jgi:hypothetical protein
VGAGRRVSLSRVPQGVTPVALEMTRRIIRDCEDEGHPVTHVWGYSSARSSDHRNRRCVDLMVQNRADGDWILGYLRRHRVQLRLRYVIWWGMQWRDYRKPGVPIRSLARYFGWNQHRDHLHVEFDA